MIERGIEWPADPGASDAETSRRPRRRKLSDRLARSTLLSGGLLLIATMFLSVGTGCPGSVGRYSTWARPLDDVIGLVESIHDWRYPAPPPQPIRVNPTSGPVTITVPFTIPQRRYMEARCHLVFGWWIPTLVVGVCAVVFAIRVVQRRYRSLMTVLLLSHVIRWPLLSTWLWWIDAKQPAERSIFDLLRFPSTNTDHVQWILPFFLAPLLVAHAIVLLTCSRRPVLAALALWAVYFISVLLVFPSVGASFWGPVLSTPFANGGLQLGAATLFIGAWLVFFGAVAMALSTAYTRGEFVGLLLWGGAGPTEPEVCAECEYSLIGLTGDRCPECGTPIRQPMSARSAATVEAG